MKKRLTCICIDDDIEARESLERNIRNLFPKELAYIDGFETELDGFFYLKNNTGKIDLLFMDIRLDGSQSNDEQGYRFIRNNHDKPFLPYVIFYSGTSDIRHVADSHEFKKVVGFIQKPEHIDDENLFVRKIASALEKIKEKEVPKTIFKLKNEDILIENARIIYITTLKKDETQELGLNHNDNKIVYINENGERCEIYSRTTIKEATQMLTKPNFYLISAACIVNYQYIKKTFRKTLESDGGIILTIGDEKVYAKENSPAWKDFLEYWNKQKNKK